MEDTNESPVEQAEAKPEHPAVKHLNEADEKLNTLGSYAVSVIKPLLDAVRETL